MNLIKNLLLVASISLSLTLSAQWEKIETVDDFGDNTGESVLRVIVNGTFSNSATAGSDLIVKVADYGDAALFTLYEYNKTPASMGYKGAFGSIKAKTSTGEIIEFDCFAPKGGGLLFSKEEHTALFKYLYDGTGTEIKFVVASSDFSDYGSAKYSFSLKTMTAEEKTKFGIE